MVAERVGCGLRRVEGSAGGFDERGGAVPETVVEHPPIRTMSAAVQARRARPAAI
jgi:hypothetical protein